MNAKDLLWSGRGKNQSCKAGRIQQSKDFTIDNWNRRNFSVIAFDADGNLLGERKTANAAKALVERNRN